MKPKKLPFTVDDVVVICYDLILLRLLKFSEIYLSKTLENLVKDTILFYSCSSLLAVLLQYSLRLLQLAANKAARAMFRRSKVSRIIRLPEQLGCLSVVKRIVEKTSTLTLKSVKGQSN